MYTSDYCYYFDPRVKLGHLFNPDLLQKPAQQIMYIKRDFKNQENNICLSNALSTIIKFGKRTFFLLDL